MSGTDWKQCPDCEETKSSFDFYPDPTKKSGLSTYCSECNRRRTNARYTDVNQLRKANLVRYGLSMAAYEDLWVWQGGVCALCHRTSRRNLCVDHDHACCPGLGSCGSCIRGLVCSNCNHMLGQARDSPELLRRGALYLEEHRGPAA